MNKNEKIYLLGYLYGYLYSKNIINNAEFDNATRKPFIGITLALKKANAKHIKIDEKLVGFILDDMDSKDVAINLSLSEQNIFLLSFTRGKTKEMCRLAILRKAKGLTQENLANKAGIPLKTLQAYEIGNRNLSGAKYDVLTNIANVLGITIDDLIK